jgi:acetylornithine/succinyldiaminopimelate/putrescine aminotransferase
VEKLINKNTAAIIVEAIQGEGGIVTAKPDFLKLLRKLCDEKNLLLICDEIQCGMGRTGKFYAFQNFGVKPDITVLAKSIANGLPLAATIVDKKCETVFSYGDHGSTFGGNPVSCAAANAVLKIMTTSFLNNSFKTAVYLREKIADLAKKYSFIKEIRGIGLMIGVEIDRPAKDIAANCLKKGLIINCVHETVLRIMPPLTITKKDVDEAVKILDEVFKDNY